MDLRGHVQAQRQFDADAKEREAAERRKRLMEQLVSTLGAEVVEALPNLDYVDGISPLIKFCFGKLQFLIRRDYQHGGFELIPTRGQGLAFNRAEQFYRALGEYEEAAFSEDQD